MNVMQNYVISVYTADITKSGHISWFYLVRLLRGNVENEREVVGKPKVYGSW